MSGALLSRTALKAITRLSCVLLAGLHDASAVDSSGRNSHFWITIRPGAGSSRGNVEDLVLANGYRSVNLESSLLSCESEKDGSETVYRITWKGNNLIGNASADTLQFNVVAGADTLGGLELRDLKVGGADPAKHGLELESYWKKITPRRVDGRRTPKNYVEIQGSIVLRNRSLKTEDPKHPFADVKEGHEMGPTPYKPTTPAKLRAFPEFSWDQVPRTMLIRKSSAYTDAEIKAIAENYDLVVLEKANGAGKDSCSEGMLDTGARLKKINPDIKTLFYWNSRIFFGHYGIDDTISQHLDDWISKTFFIRDGLKTYVRENKDFLKWWVGCCAKMIADPAIDGTFVDKAGVPVYMLDALYKATPANKLVMNNNAEARQRIGYVDGTYREGWSGGHDPDTIATTIAIAHETGINKKMQILRMPVKSATSPRDMEDKIDRGLAIYLLYAQPYSYFYWQVTVDARKGKLWQWDASHIDQLNRPLGKPLGSYVRDDRVYTRTFEHCDVFMDLRPTGSTRILWKNNVGDPALKGGGYSRTDDSYILKGGGAFAAKSDRFFFMSDAHYGDGLVKVSVDGMKDAPEAKAGIMFRESLEANAAMVAVLRDAAGKMHMVYRSRQGGNLARAGMAKSSRSRYAMIARKGDAYTGYASADGESWSQIAEVKVPMAEKVEMGMAVASHSKTAQATVAFSGFERIEPSAKNGMDDGAFDEVGE
ncbi:putative glycoside hydrolase [Pontiellaceae bacterium B12227]|nr:putative glycoside hydrolase [Pontiellaceae bacterium B12227]